MSHPRTARTLAAAALPVAFAATALAGCSGTGPAGPGTAAPTPITRLNTHAMSIVRADFCRVVPAYAVRAAVGGGRIGRASWRNGQDAQLEPSTKGVAHEYGCRWTGRQGSAQAWVFATSVDAKLAQSVVAEARSTAKGGCTVTDATFGSPSLQQVCAQPDGSHRVRLAGLFGDTWLTCETATTGLPDGTALRRTQAWCVQVANATNTRP